VSVVVDFAHTPRAEQARHRKARILARWCYQRGVLAGVSALPPPLLRFIAHEAGVRAPHQDAGGCSETWQQVDAVRTGYPVGLCREWEPLHEGIRWVSPRELAAHWASAAVVVVTVPALPGLT